MNWSEIFLGAIIGSFLGTLLTAFLDWQRRPNLTITVDDNPNKGLRIVDGRTFEYKFANVVVKNESRNFLGSLLYGNIPANNCRAWVIFQDYDTKAELLKINARWATNREPVFAGILDLGSILVVSRESVPVGDSASITVAVKTNQTSDIFGFNNENYMYYPTFPSPYNSLWGKDTHNIGCEKRYRVFVKILADGNTYCEGFLLVNNQTLDSFKLIALGNEEY